MYLTLMPQALKKTYILKQKTNFSNFIETLGKNKYVLKEWISKTGELSPLLDNTASKGFP